MRCSFLPTRSTLEMEGDDEYDALYKFLYEHVYPANINEKDKKRAFRRKQSRAWPSILLPQIQQELEAGTLRKRKAKNPQCLSCSSYGYF